MNLLQRQFGVLGSTWRSGYGAEVKRSAIAFLLLVLLSFGVSLAVPALRESVIQRVVQMMGSLNVTNENGTLSAAALFSNNLRACTFTMLYGLVPFVPLSALALGMNAILLGVLAAQYFTGGTSLLLYFLALLPHGIFELPALVLSFAMGLYVCDQVTRRCRKDETAVPVLDCLVLMGWLLMLVLIPLLAVAAAVEAYITPLLLSCFL